MSSQYISIQSNLSKFYSRWSTYEKNERQGYQTFLLEFLACYGIKFSPNNLPFETKTSNGFVDAYLKDIAVFEMKSIKSCKTRINLSSHLKQAMKYWEAKEKSAPFIVICNFREFLIYDTRDQSKHFVKLGELETKASSFDFLRKLNPSFVPEQEVVSKKTAQLMGKLYKSLKYRMKGREEEVDIFVLQCLFCLFSEDIGYLPSETFTSCVRRIRDGEDNSANILSTLFKMMDERDSARKKGKFEQVRYFNGPLFRIKPEIVLNEQEIDILWLACQQDWKNVRPEIFGALFESTQSKKDRHDDGMHFTSEDDILKVVRPCVIQPWEEDLAKCKTQEDFIILHSRLKSYRVLDPACGSGNFLVVAYRELKRLEAKIFSEYKRAAGISYIDAQKNLGWLPLANMYGIEVNAFPSFLTRVSLWITKKLIKNEYKLIEPDLPLEELKHIINADALDVKWDDVDVVIGNPPYIGSKQLKEARGAAYMKRLEEKFPDHNKLADYCTYWFEKVFEDVRPGVRVGLVCTNSIAQNNSRAASLDKVISSGGIIFNAITNQKWSGEANVTVSIVNFVHKQSADVDPQLNNKPVNIISSRLLSFQTKSEAKKLSSNLKIAFQGVTSLGKTFTLNDKEAHELLLKGDKYKDVIKKFYTASSVVDSPSNEPSEWVIDFQSWPLEKAMEYPAALSIVEKRLKNSSKKRNKTRSNNKQKWWQFWRPRPELRVAITDLKKYVLVSRHTKYPTFIFVNSKTSLCEDSTVAIAVDDYQKLGVLQSKFHTDWYKYQCSTLESRFRYTNTTVFETFPFPSKENAQIGKIMAEIEHYRHNNCKKLNIGLTDLYNQMSEGGHQTLAQLHKRLDSAVATAYGYPKTKISSYRDIINFLVKLNLARVNKVDAASLRIKKQKTTGSKK